MNTSRLLKALVIQGLFISNLWAQSLVILAPKPGAPLDDVQTFRIGFTDLEPERINFYLDGALVQARTKPPYHFDIRWDATRTHEVVIEAVMADGSTVRTRETYRQIQIDVAQQVEVFQVFPYFDAPPRNIELRSRGRQTTPQVAARADGRLALDLVVVLDVSGSMRETLRPMSEAFAALWRARAASESHIRLITFDAKPRLVDLQEPPENLRSLYRREPKSVVWDALATGTGLFGESPRRTILLISDGADDGSVHNAETCAQFLRQYGASLIWLNPADFANPALANLARRSGGFFTNDWREVIRRFEHQYHLVAPGAGFPIELRADPGRAWYPRWD